MAPSTSDYNLASLVSLALLRGEALAAPAPQQSTEDTEGQTVQQLPDFDEAAFRDFRDLLDDMIFAYGLKAELREQQTKEASAPGGGLAQTRSSNVAAQAST